MYIFITYIIAIFFCSCNRISEKNTNIYLLCRQKIPYL